MKRISTISIVVLLLFGSCHRESKEVKVSYSVTESSVDSPSFNITYVSDQSGATTIASSTSASWTSGGIMLEKEQFISMTVDCSAPVYDFVVSVYVDGHLFDRKELHNPAASVTISGRAN